MRHNAVFEKLRSGTQVVNGWVSLDSDHAGEVLSHAGFDAVTVDLQHGMFGLERAISILRSVSAGPAVPMARSARNDGAQIGKLLDAGAYGIICPNINSRAEAEDFVSACRYPSSGNRSFGPARGLLYGGPDYVRHANAEVLTWAMIESPEGVSHAEEIINTPELDGIYIGPNDLAFAMGEIPNGTISGEILEIIKELIGLAHGAGRFVGIYTRDGVEANYLLKMGVDLVTPGNDVSLINTEAAARIAQARR